MNYITNKNFYQRIGCLENTSSIKRDTILNISVEQNMKILNNQTVEEISNYCRNPKITSNANSTSNFNVTSFSETQQSRIPNGNNSSDSSQILVALTEGRGHAQGEIGLAGLDVNSPSLLLCQFSDGFLYHGCIIKLQIINPTEIIIPLTIYNAGSKLLDTIKINLPNIKITPLPRRHFNVEEGLAMISSLCSPEYKSTLMLIERKYYATTAASGLLKYLKNILMVNFLKNSLKVEYETRYGRMLINHETCHRLELLYPLCSTKEKKACLYGVLDNTLTAIGKRHLRARLLEPFCSLSNIFAIQECIKELLENSDIFINLEELLKKYSNVDKLLKLSIQPPEGDQIKSVEIMLNQILLLKTSLENLPELASIINTSKSKVLSELKTILNDSRFKMMLIEINKILQPEVQNSRGSAQCFQRIFAIRPGVNDLLDLSRKIYTELADTIRDTISKLSTEYFLPFRMIYTTSKGFHIQLTGTRNNPLNDVPTGLDIIYKKGNNFYLTNAELIKLNVRMTDVINEIHLLSDSIARTLIGNLIQHVDANYLLVGAVSNIDIILSYTKVSLRDGFCCPNFGDEMRIVDGIHPLLEYSRMKPVPIPNNIIATPEYNCYIITGPNMGGKTVYIKTIAMLQIMAQIGCFVPAKCATFRICDNIFTRMGFEDYVEQNASNFAVEMREMEHIFKTITPNSLILIDELCRSTNPKEGEDIALRLCEKLATLRGIKNDGNYYENNQTETPNGSILSISSKLQNIKLNNITSPFIYITTHFLSLTKLTIDYLNVVNLHLMAEENFINDKLHLVYKHKVLEGITPIKGYGISLARCIRLPENIIPRAEELLDTIVSKKRAIQILETSKVSESKQPFIEELENTIRTEGSNVYNKLNITTNIITSFINKSTLNQNLTTTCQNVSIKEVVKDFEGQLYDLYSNFAAIFRDKKTSFKNEDLIDLLNNFIENQPQKLMEQISKSKSNIINNNESKNNNNTFRPSTSTEIFNEIQNISDISYHSFLRRQNDIDKSNNLSPPKKGDCSSRELYQHMVSSDSSCYMNLAKTDNNISDKITKSSQIMIKNSNNDNEIIKIKSAENIVYIPIKKRIKRIQKIWRKTNENEKSSIVISRKISKLEMIPCKKLLKDLPTEPIKNASRNTI